MVTMLLRDATGPVSVTTDHLVEVAGWAAERAPTSHESRYRASDQAGRDTARALYLAMVQGARRTLPQLPDLQLRQILGSAHILRATYRYTRV